jgi:hypothetical protein
MAVGEKRKHARTRVELTVLVTVGNEPPLLGRTVDLSLGGMYILHPGPPPRFGAEVRVRIGDSNSALSLHATVRWSANDGFGVQFGLLGARETRAVLDLVKLARAEPGTE